MNGIINQFVQLLKIEAEFKEHSLHSIFSQKEEICKNSNRYFRPFHWLHSV